MSDKGSEVAREDVEIVRALEAILMVAMEPVDPSLLAQLLEQPVAAHDLAGEPGEAEAPLADVESVSDAQVAERRATDFRHAHLEHHLLLARHVHQIHDLAELQVRSARQSGHLPRPDDVHVVIVLSTLVGHLAADQRQDLGRFARIARLSADDELVGDGEQLHLAVREQLVDACLQFAEFTRRLLLFRFVRGDFRRLP